MIILGINGGYFGSEVIWRHNTPGLHDSSCCFLVDNNVTFATEEERFARIKHCNYFPENAIAAGLRQIKICITDVDIIAISWSEKFHQDFIEELYLLGFPVKSMAPSELYRSYMEEKFSVNLTAEIVFISHHDAHLWSVYGPSPCDNIALLALDGSGDGSNLFPMSSGAYGVGSDSKLQIIKRFPENQSIGFLYTDLISIIGFSQFEEYKAMGLAAYGNSQKFYDTLSSVLKMIEKDRDFNSENWRSYRISVLNGDFKVRHSERADFASAIQKICENRIVQKVKEVHRRAKLSVLGYTGGVAQNTVANSRIAAMPEVKKLVLGPCPGDMGTAIGAAFCSAANLGVYKKSKILKINPFIGTSSRSVVKVRGLWGKLCDVIDSKDTLGFITSKLLKNKTIGLFQGRAEFGPRALGNRSILANPQHFEMRTHLNTIVKKREDYRPFGAVVLEEDASIFFDINECVDYRYMGYIVEVKRQWQSKLKAITHIDGTCRIQTVHHTFNPVLTDILNRFKMANGFAVLLNTSFNGKFEPIVQNSDEAFYTFVLSGIDYLFMDGTIICKCMKKKEIVRELFVGGLRLKNCSITTDSNGKGYLLNHSSVGGLKEHTFENLDLFELEVVLKGDRGDKTTYFNQLSDIGRREVTKLMDKRLLVI